MEITAKVAIDFDDVLLEMSDSETEDLAVYLIENLPIRSINNVLGRIDKQDMVCSLTAKDICDYADEREIVDELTRRGWKLTDEDDE